MSQSTGTVDLYITRGAERELPGLLFAAIGPARPLVDSAPICLAIQPLGGNHPEPGLELPDGRFVPFREEGRHWHPDPAEVLGKAIFANALVDDEPLWVVEPDTPDLDLMAHLKRGMVPVCRVIETPEGPIVDYFIYGTREPAEVT